MITKSIKIPDINLYSEFRPFLSDFIRLNKAHNKNFSLRFFANKLGWSVSHLNDLIQGRRSISLQKVLELSDYLGLKGVRAERLLFLALFSSEELNGKYRDFLASRNSSLNVRTMTSEEKDLFVSALLFHVFEYLIWKKGVWSEADFLARIRRPDKVKSSELRSIIRTLEERAIISWDASQERYSINKNNFYNDVGKIPASHFVKLEKEFLKIHEEFLDDRFGGWQSLGCMLQMPEYRLSEIKERLISLRNYLYEISEEAVSAERDPNLKTGVHLFQLTFFELFRPDHAVLLSAFSSDEPEGMRLSNS